MERELEALQMASQGLDCSDAMILTWDYEEFTGLKIRYIPLWKWLLG